jgi:pimeloyl-ACP methyl ester carboxylesterase
MTHKTTLADQIRGLLQLVMEATDHVTTLVETVHLDIASGPTLLGRPLKQLSKHLVSPTYRLIRGHSKLVGGVLDAALQQLAPLLDQAGAERGKFLAVINGVIGDHLESSGHPLAIPMRLCLEDQTLDLSTTADVLPPSARGRRLLIAVHGSCLDETSWQRRGHSHPAALAREFGLTLLYLRYNTGRHISTNGRDFAQLLEHLYSIWPEPVDEIVLLGHSLGGLVIRSACHVAEQEHYRWRPKLTTLITLGTPHHGAPLERLGSWIDFILGIHRYSAPFSRLGKLRSAGVTDLRYGSVLDEDWQGKDRFAERRDPRGRLSLPADVACFAIAGTSATSLTNRLAGDGVVPVDSALGRHPSPSKRLRFPADHQWIALQTSHLGLLHRPEVNAKLRTWLKLTMTARLHLAKPFASESPPPANQTD